jgi:hypothetical protein
MCICVYIQVVTKTRKKIHLLRKFFHALAGVLMAGTPTDKKSLFFSFLFQILPRAGTLATNL